MGHAQHKEKSNQSEQHADDDVHLVHREREFIVKLFLGVYKVLVAVVQQAELQAGKLCREAALAAREAELARQLLVSAKTVSKWETAKGLPDISLLEPLAAALGVSVLELMQGEPVVNRNRAANLLRSKLYRFACWLR